MRPPRAGDRAHRSLAGSAPTEPATPVRGATSRQALIKKYAPIAFVFFVVFMVFFLRHYFYK